MLVPVIETARLTLRGFAASDFEAFAAMRADPAVMRYIGTGRAQTRDEAAVWQEKNRARWHDRGLGQWAVVETETRDFCGWCGLGVLEETDEIEVGYGFAPRAWGRGFATEAARASLRFGFEEKKLERIAAIALPENAASRRVMEKLGMSYVRPAHHYGVDVVYYSISRQEFDHGPSPYVLHETPDS